ncbi:unnamed protein product [Durusdinium trenchii]|uniref:Uncharacterized protein n=2 Tax=Durusdinium trenchii TaxID=1381693 RepID=A0ABP0HH90_9DINO
MSGRGFAQHAVPTCLLAGGVGLGLLVWRWRSQVSDAPPRPSRRLPTCRAPWLTAGDEERPRVVLVCTGSVASVKVPELVVALRQKLDAQVAVLLTEAAEAMTSAKIAGRYAPESFTKWEELQQSVDVHVLRDLDEWEGYEDVSSDLVVHIELRKWADLAVVAPCSANTLAKMALGLCDNLATSFLRAWDPEKPLVLAPAMNTIMWEHPSTAKHLKTLEDWFGCWVVPPVSKRLACGDVGRGALASVSDIMERIAKCCEGMEGRRNSSAVGAWQRRGFQEWQKSPWLKEWQPRDA